MLERTFINIFGQLTYAKRLGQLVIVEEKMVRKGMEIA